MEQPYTVSEFIERCNTLLAHEFEDIYIEGEVASFKVNQGKWLFFDLKEGDNSLNCFMVPQWLTSAITDGMKVRVRATPKLTRWGKFSLTVHQVVPIGEGNIKKSFELLKKKLTAEGLFDPARKRPLPRGITKIGVISSTGAAGYIDFLKILDNRWGGLKIQTINTLVQGMSAPAQIIRALNYFNEHSDVEVIAILRGGGSADDLSAFNDEALARAIAASRIPVITGIGHEVDESLADLAADVRASTPSNAAERLTPDKSALVHQTALRVAEIRRFVLDYILRLSQNTASTISSAYSKVQNAPAALLAETAHKMSRTRADLLSKIEQASSHTAELARTLTSLNPEDVLRRGYAIIAHHPPGQFVVGEELTITVAEQILTAELKNVHQRP